MRTDYKHSKTKSYSAFHISTNWTLPLAITLLAFVLVWKWSDWARYYIASQNEEWLDSDQVDPNQETLDLILPGSQERILFNQSTTTTAPSHNKDTARFKSFTIKAGDNLASYFQQAGLDPKALQEVLSLDRNTHHLKRIYPGQVLRIQPDDKSMLKTLQFDVDPLTTLIVERQNGKLLSHIEDKPIEKRVAFGGSKIFDSFFVAGKHAKLDDALIMELASIFAYDIDFALDIKPNDHFKVLFEEYFVNGVKVGNGPIVAAEFVNNGKQYRAIRYKDPSGQTSYYSPNGQSLKKAFIRTPVQYTRISSHFNLQRRHPILHQIRAHKGVDYAAPHGTPVKAAGQGKVVFVGKKGGYGNTIILQHGSKYTTLYGHLSRFAKNLKSGGMIHQGQIIGYVGSTGLASGPHLHFEFRVNGVHQNPLTVALPQAEGITGKSKTKFLAYSNELLRMMDHHGKVLVAAND